MSTRAFRARPVDPNRPLPIVRDLGLLDSAEGLPAREVVHNHAALDADNEKPQMIKPKDGKGGKEIPIPGVTKVPTYETDYLPCFLERNTYIREKGQLGFDDSSFIEIDLDGEDMAWLDEINQGQDRLSFRMMEVMLHKLEVSNAAATDRGLTAVGAAPAEKMSVAACASTDYLQREDALQILEEACPARDVIRVAVYEYWLQKRKKRGKPILRRLQAPTPPNDSNPYNVFRPRERINRPQTRRRRENNEDSLEKLRMIRENLLRALDLFEVIVKREQRKRDFVYIDTDMQMLQIKLRHAPRLAEEADYLAAARSKAVRRPVGFDLPPTSLVTTNGLLEFKNSKNKRRRRLGEAPILNAVAQLPPPPLPVQEPFVFECLPSVCDVFRDHHLREFYFDRISQSPHRGRFGRGNRFVVDRCDPFDMEETQADEDDELLKPFHERRNPYANWLGGPDLLSVALAKQEPAQASNGSGTIVRLKVSLPSADGSKAGQWGAAKRSAVRSVKSQAK